MQNCRIIFLLLSSLLVSSCAYHKLTSYKKTSERLITNDNLKSVIPSTIAVKYKASIDVLNKHFTGLIILKQTDVETRHLVFVTELGMRMFDFEMKGDNLKAVFVFDALNKPELVAALIRNFKTILLMEWFSKSAEVMMKSGKEVLHLKKDRHHLFLISDEKQYAVKQHVFNKRKKETKTIYTDYYKNIKLTQYGLVKLYIELEKINE